MMNTCQYLYIGFALILIGCGEARGLPEPSQPLTIHVGLDLSDRIVVEDQLIRDTTAVGKIIEYVEERGSYGDRLSIEVIPQDESFDWYPVREDLQVDLSSMSIRELREDLPRRFERMREAVRWLYEHARRQDQFTGSDTYTWLRDLYVPRSTEAGAERRVIILFTDGYTISNNRSRVDNETTFISTEAVQRARSCSSDDISSISLRPPRKDLQDVDVLVFGLRPRVKHPCELEILEKVNARWFKSMNTRDVVLDVSRPDLASVKTVVRSFLTTDTEVKD